MSHEMKEHDSAAIFAKPAWHGLGNVIEHAMSIDDALQQAGLGWTVRKSHQIYADMAYSDEYNAVIREDTGQILGITTPSYKVLQNEEAFELAKAFGNTVKVESAGSIQNGRQAYLLLRGETFDAGWNDEINKYMALFWSHDGSMSLTGLPTSIRVQCKNTLDMVIGQSKDASNKITIHHKGDMESKFEQAREAIARFNEIGTFFEEKVTHLSRSNPSREELNNFFAGIYKMLTGNVIVSNPQDEKEERTLLDATTRISKWVEIMQDEADTNGFAINYWTAANAVTNDIQHRVATKGRKRTPVSKAYGNLIGKNAVDSRKVFNAALACA